MQLPIQTSDVFGLNQAPNENSYVDRGSIDRKIKVFLGRDEHIAIRGDSKVGKSWLRQRIFDNPIVVQCRLGKTPVDLYREALGEIGVKLTVKESVSKLISGEFPGENEAGFSLLSKVKLKLAGKMERQTGKQQVDLKSSIENLKFVSELINESGRRLVIEDFHYLSEETRKAFAFDLKAMWDYRCFIIIIGV